MSRKKTSDDDKQLVLLAPYIQRNQLHIPKTATFEEWLDAGRALRLCRGALQWWVGDWLNRGEELFKDRAIQEAADILGLDAGTCATWSSVCKAFPADRRKELSFEHHKELRVMTEKQQDKWLEKAVAGNWSRGELRGAIKNAGAKKERKPKKKAGTVQRHTTADLYPLLKEKLTATMLLVPPLVELASAMNDSWEEHLPDQKSLDMLERTNEELLQSLHGLQNIVLELESVEAKAA